MKRVISTVSLAAMITCSAMAGVAIKPISNPVYTDVPETSLNIRPIFMHHKLPSKLNTGIGDVPVGGDVQIFAVQFEIPLSDTLSIIAVKDGYISLNPDATLSEEDGFGDLAGGLKYIFSQGDDTAASVRAVVEFPIGDDEVFQGNGDGNINVGATWMKRTETLQFLTSIGYIHALDGAESSLLYDSWHFSFPLTERVSPLIELNHFHVVDEGDGDTQFDAHVEGGVPAVALWEGGDLINLGAANAGEEADFVTLAVGARFLAAEDMNFGIAYEFPLTDEENGLMDSRITIDAVLTF